MVAMAASSSVPSVARVSQRNGLLRHGWASQRQHQHQHQQQVGLGIRGVVVARAAEGAGELEIPPWEEDFDLLSTKISELVEELQGDLSGCSIYLVGMMGCGKSTLGKMLANTLNYNFFDSDSMVEMTHDNKSVADIFKEYGQDYFRDVETQVLKQLGPHLRLVVATGGGAVLRPMNWSYMQQGVVVWLSGSPELHAKRVSKDGLEKRPLLAEAGTEGDSLYDAALKKVTSMLEERKKFYQNADIVVPLDSNGRDSEMGAPTAVVLYRLLTELKAKMQEKKESREAKKNFKIENVDELKTMRTQPSPNADA